MKTSLEHKTIRPGSLSDYSFYYSNRALAQSAPAKTTKPAKRDRPRPRFGIWLVVLAIVTAGYIGFQHSEASGRTTNSQSAPAVADATTCAGNTLNRFIKVSISKRRLWACEGTHVVYNSPVITGMAQYASTVTPPGTYKINAKQHDTVLTGADQTGSWRDPVSYWMPFLDNQYGTYGFHDATWRDPSAFGKVDPNSDQASHGCVELPLATSQWLYNWSDVGTILTITA